MTSPPLEPRVRRLENDVTAIYQLLGEIQVKVNEHDLRFDSMEARFDGVDTRLDGLSGQMSEVLEILRAR